MHKAITIQQVEGKPGQVYYPLSLNKIPTPTPAPNELQISILAAALNHRDLFLRQHLYPSPSFAVPLLADGCGIVTSVGSSASKSWLGKRVILTPGRGWDSDPKAPESPTGYKILGGTKTIELGTLQEFVCVDENEVEEAPGHLNDAEAAALPLTGLTGWRALVTKAEVEEGHNVLVTGIGGGVALNVLQFAVGKGARVWVTSSSKEKIERAVEMRAQGGVSYRDEGWEKELRKKLPKERGWFDAIVDGAGGNVMSKATRLLRPGGIVVQYGMTVAPKMDWPVNAMLMNIELRGSTMGSRKEFKEMIKFVNEKKIRPIVSRTVKGIDNIKDIDGLFEDMKKGSQFGKLVIEVSDGSKEGGGSKL